METLELQFQQAEQSHADLQKSHTELQAMLKAAQSHAVPTAESAEVSDLKKANNALQSQIKMLKEQELDSQDAFAQVHSTPHPIMPY